MRGVEPRSSLAQVPLTATGHLAGHTLPAMMFLFHSANSNHCLCILVLLVLLWCRGVNSVQPFGFASVRRPLHHMKTVSKCSLK